MDELAHAVAYVLALAAMQFVVMVARIVGKTRFWRRVQERSQSYYDDPTHPASDPQTAAEMALVDEQRDSINKVAARIKNGHTNGTS